jgi:outer membrane protein TolC
MGTIAAAVASIDLAQQSEELAAEDLRVSQERYRLGLATILDLQSAQITLLSAQVDVIRRRFEYQLGLARLEALLGTNLR